MILLSHLITFTCFPGLIIFKPLPREFFKGPTMGVYDEEALIWMNCINLGSFFCFNALGICISSTCLRQKKDFHWTFCLFIIVGLLSSAGVIIAGFDNVAVSQIAIFMLAFLHGMTSSYFATWWPPVHVLPNNLQA